MDRLLDFLINFYGPTPYFVVLGLLMAAGIGLPIPEDVTLLTSGVMCYYGLTAVFPMLVVALIGVLGGDTTMYWLGRTYGRKLTKKGIFHRLLPDDRLDAVKERFHRGGNKTVFVARFLPGFRAPIFFSAGTLHLPYRVFLFYDGMAALLYVPLIIGMVYHFGDNIDYVFKMIQNVEHGIILVVLAVVLAIVGKWYITHRRLKRS